MSHVFSNNSNLIKPSWILVIVFVANIFLFVLMFVLDFENSQVNQISTYTGVSIFLLVIYFIATRFNLVRTLSQKIQIVQSNYYNALLIIVLFSYSILPLFYWVLTEESRNQINILYLLFTPFYIVLVYHLVYIIAAKIPGNKKQNEMYLSITQENKKTD